MSDTLEGPQHDAAAAHVGPGRKLSDAEAAALARQISGITRAGLPLPGGLRAMALELPLGSLRAVLLELAGQLELGMTLDAALARLGPRLPPHLAGLVRAGMQSRRLDEILAQYVRSYSLAAQLQRNTVTSLIYPAVLLMVFLSVFSFLIMGIVPKFKKIFMDFGVELPHVTLSLLYFSDAMIEFWPSLLLACVVLVPAGWLACRLFLSPPGRWRLLYRTPLVGPIWHWTGLAQFARLLAMLVDCELGLPVALRLAGNGVRDAEVTDAAHEMAREIEAGQSLTESQTRRSRFPGGLAQSLQWGESSHSLAESLRTAAEMLEGQAMIHSEFVLRVAPPMTMILVVVLLGFVVTGLFMPLIKLITGLSG